LLCACAQILRLSTVAAEQGEIRKATQLDEVYRVLLDSGVCLKNAVIEAAIPTDDSSLEPCKACSGCKPRGRSKDVSSELAQVWRKVFDKQRQHLRSRVASVNQPSVNHERMELEMETSSSTIGRYAGLASKLIFAGVQSGVLREEKHKTDKKRLAKGKHWHFLGPACTHEAASIRISFDVADEDDHLTAAQARESLADISEASSDSGQDDSSDEHHSVPPPSNQLCYKSIM
jgi:hypothetical protein